MGITYAIVMGLWHAAPWALTLLVAAIIWRCFLFGRKLGWLWAFGLALGLSCLKPALERFAVARDIKSVAASEVRPNDLPLKPGRLLRMEESNSAGISCAYSCDELKNLSFATEIEVGSWHNLQEDSSSFDLWQAIEDRTAYEDFPYDYALVSVPIYTLPYVDGAIRTTDLPRKIQSAHFLTSVPPDGILDLRKIKPLYLRYALQQDVSNYFSWGLITTTHHVPEVEEIILDLAAIARPASESASTHPQPDR